MSNQKLLIIILMITSSFNVSSQYSFKEIAQTQHNGEIRSIALGKDSTLFATLDSGSLRAYEYNNNSFKQTAFLKIRNNSKIEVNTEGIIYLSNGRDGLYAFRYTGNSFEEISHIDDGSIARDFTIYKNGIIFIANGDGISAYDFDGLKFIKKGDFQSKEINSITVSPNGTLFTASLQGELKAFSFKNNKFSHITTIFNEYLTVTSLAADSSGNVFLATFSKGLYALKYTGNSFVKITNNDDIDAYKLMIHDEKLYVTGFGGLSVYSFDNNKFNLIIRTNNYELYGWDMEISNGGFIILAAGGNGIITYNQSENELTEINHFDEFGNAYDITLPENESTIFLSNFQDGVRIYDFNNEKFKEINHLVPFKLTVAVSILNDSTIVTANGSYGISIYRKIGNSYYLYGKAKDGFSSFARDISILSDSIFIVANGTDGLRAYKYSNNKLENIAHLKTNGYTANRIKIKKDGTIFLTNWNDGLYAFHFDGNSFLELDHISNDGFIARDLGVLSDSIIFIANSSDGIRIYNFDGISFEKIGHYKSETYNTFYSIDIGKNNTVFALANDSDIFAFQYKDSKLYKVANFYEENPYCDANSIKSLNNGLVYVASGSCGLKAYSYSGFSANFNVGNNSKKQFELLQNYPNPFSHTTNINFKLNKNHDVKLIIYDSMGNVIQKLINTYLEFGSHNIKWDGTYSNGKKAPNGLYFYKLTAGEYTDIKKMILINNNQ